MLDEEYVPGSDEENESSPEKSNRVHYFCVIVGFFHLIINLCREQKSGRQKSGRQNLGTMKPTRS